jgi:hypothetical protein
MKLEQMASSAVESEIAREVVRLTEIEFELLRFSPDSDYVSYHVTWTLT